MENFNSWISISSIILTIIIGVVVFVKMLIKRKDYDGLNDKIDEESIKKILTAILYLVFLIILLLAWDHL